MKQLRVTASEVELRQILSSVDALELLEADAFELLEEVKRQMYLDGAEAMLQSLNGPSARIDRTRFPATASPETDPSHS